MNPEAFSVRLNQIYHAVFEKVISIEFYSLFAFAPKILWRKFCICVIVPIYVARKLYVAQFSFREEVVQKVVGGEILPSYIVIASQK